MTLYLDRVSIGACIDIYFKDTKSYFLMNSEFHYHNYGHPFSGDFKL